MRVKRIDTSDTKVTLTITADQAFLDRAKNATLKHLGNQHLKLPGFREGKAPLALVEKNVDPTRLQNEFLEEAINRLYVESIRAEKLRPVSQPEVSVKKFVPFTELEIDAVVEVIGEIKIPNYKNIKKKPAKVTVSEKDIDDVIETLKRRMAEKSEVSRPARDGDEVMIDFSGSDDKGNPVNGADGKDYPLLLGSNTFIPGFEPNIVGLKAGEEKTFDVVFPKDYQVKALINKKVTFKVKVKAVNELKAPKVDNAFAAKAGPFKTLKELKEDIKKQLTQERANDAQRAFENDLIQEIAAGSKVAIPEILIDDQVQRSEDEERRNLAYRGQTWQEHLAEEGVTEDEHRKRQRGPAKENIKASLVLSEISDRENIEVTPEELEIRIQILKGQYTDKAMQAELDKPENRNELTSRILTEKTLAKLVEYTTKV